MIDEKKNEESKNKGGAPKKSSYNVHQRISRIMSELDYVKKDKAIKDKSGKKMYSVTGHDNVTNMIHPLLVKHGVNIIPDMDDVTQEGNRTRVKIVFSVVNIDSPDDFFTQRWYAYGIDHSDKGIGKACSYAQRMFILRQGIKTLKKMMFPIFQNLRKRNQQRRRNQPLERGITPTTINSWMHQSPMIL